MPRLFLVRHCQSEYNLAGRFAGARSDIDLSAAGLQQAEQLRGRLAGEKIDAIYSSSMKRALTTARIISENKKLEVVSCPELSEIDYGLVEGRTFDEVRRDYPEIAQQILGLDPKIRFPGGESFEEFTSRICRFPDRVVQYDDNQTVLIVAHGGSIRTLICSVLGIEISKHWAQIRIDNASLTVLEMSRNGAIISLLNDTSHLKG